MPAHRTDGPVGEGDQLLGVVAAEVVTALGEAGGDVAAALRKWEPAQRLDYFWTAVHAGRSRQHTSDGATREVSYAAGELRDPPWPLRAAAELEPRRVRDLYPFPYLRAAPSGRA